MSKKLLLLAFLPFFYLVAKAQDDRVSLFEQCNYTGNKHELAAGTYRLHEMKVDNDKLSSMIIPNGMKVTIYENDNFEGRSRTYNSNTACLEDGWRNMASSLVIEKENRPQSNFNQNHNQNQNEYVTFFNDCNFKGYSQSLHAGTYTGNQLGALKYNISSWTISGNLRIHIYLNNENLAGSSADYETNMNCLPGNQNDKIGSLTIEYMSNNQDNHFGNQNNISGGNNYATIYTDCNYRGNSLRLAPGYYQGDKLGLLKYAISSIQMPPNLTAKVYLNNEYLAGTYYTLTGNTSCLSGEMNDRIGSMVIEENNGNHQNDNHNEEHNDNHNDNQNHFPSDHFDNHEKVILYADKDYQGQSATLSPGSYNNMAAAGFLDNALSSITIPPGFRVILYDKENFRGSSVTLTESRGGLGLMGFNDKTSSIVVYRDR